MKKTIRLTEQDLVNLIERIVKEQENQNNLHEGTKAKKPKPMKSRRSGIKTQKIIDQNHKVLKRLVSEQPESRFGPEQYMNQSERQAMRSGNPQQAGQALYSGAQKQSQAIHSINPHTVASIVGIASLFIPVVGPFIAAGIGMMDAGMYMKEGKKKEAAIVGLFSLLPGILKVTKMIPGVAQLGAKGMAALGSKVASGAALTTSEAAIVDTIAANQAVISSEAQEVAKNMAREGANKVANQATKDTLNHIAKHGLEKGTEHALVHSAGEHGTEQVPKVAGIAKNIKRTVGR